jgi:hypothetical protein
LLLSLALDSTCHAAVILAENGVNTDAVKFVADNLDCKEVQLPGENLADFLW